MGISVFQDKEQKLAIFVHQGLITDQEFLDTYQNLIAKNPFIGMNIFADLSGCDARNRSGTMIKQLAMIVKNARKKIETKQHMAIFAPQALNFGLSRMFEGFVDGSNLEIGVFSKKEDACKWLNIDVDTIEKITNSGKLLEANDSPENNLDNSS